MGYTIEHIAYDKAIEMAKEFQYALLYKLSEMILCKTSELVDSAWEECTEARLFRNDAEIHIIWDEDDITAILVKDSNEQKVVDYILKEYRLIGRYAKMGTKGTFLVKQYLQQDEDGQKYIALSRLMDIL